MSEKQKTLVEKLAALPPQLQDKFIDKADGAIMALDFIAENAAADTETAQKEGG